MSQNIPMNKSLKALSPTERINFDDHVSVTWCMTIVDGKYKVSGSENDRSDLARSFSLMKHGHVESVEIVSAAMARTAITTPSFLNFVRDAAVAGRQLYITSPGVMNLPSASNLVLKETATLINMYLTDHELPPLVIVEMTRLGEVRLNYSDWSKAERLADRANRSIIPEMFRNGSVVYLDDIYITGSVAENANDRIRHEIGAHDVYFLFGAVMDPDVVKSTDGKIEGELNRFAVDESMRDLIKLFSEPCNPTQKALRLFFQRANTRDLQEAFTQLSVDTIYMLYQLACQNGYQTRWDGECAESMKITKSYLTRIGILGNDGLPIMNHQM